MKQLFLGSSLLMCLAGFGAAHAQLQTTGYTFSRQQGISTSSSAQTTTLSSSRVLGQSCKNQVQDWYREQGIANWADQGCITEPENVIALPLVPGQLEQFQIIDKTRKFGVADQVVGSTSESATNQKAVSGFTGMGLSVFIQPQN
jgi:DNA phosphorothioation-dependent restriction protein DptG